MRYTRAEASFEAAVVDVDPMGDGVVWVVAVAPNGLGVTFEAFEGEYAIGDLVTVTITRT